MIKWLRETVSILKKDIFVGERREKNLLDISVTSVIVAAIGLVMFLVNLVHGSFTVGLSPLTFLICGALSFYFVRMRRARTPAVVLTMIAVVVVFTYDIVFVNNGFAFLWTMLVPLAISYMFGVKEGILLSAYFLLLYIVFFWTPARQLLAGGYPEIVLTRFPILYFFHSLLTGFVMLRYQKNALSEIEYSGRLREEVARQTKMATERADKLQELSDEIVETLAHTIDAKDRYTNGHSFRVSLYGGALAERLGWDEAQLKAFRREALLHDIGKIGVPDAVLNKSGHLTPEEYDVIKSHTTIGKNILTSMAELDSVDEVALYHHERWDGKGYPSGLAGEAIPEHARIVAIADSYDAMSSDRTYRKALSRARIREELVQGRGTQFDPQLLDVFLEMFDSGALDGLETLDGEKA